MSSKKIRKIEVAEIPQFIVPYPPKVTVEEILSMMSHKELGLKRINSFFIYRKVFVKELRLADNNISVKKISSIIGKLWSQERVEVKKHYQELSNQVENLLKERRKSETEVPFLKVPYPPELTVEEILMKRPHKRYSSRAPNSFLIYRMAFLKELKKKTNDNVSMTKISPHVKKSWSQERAEVKKHYQELSSQVENRLNEKRKNELALIVDPPQQHPHPQPSLNHGSIISSEQSLLHNSNISPYTTHIPLNFNPVFPEDYQEIPYLGYSFISHNFIPSENVLEFPHQDDSLISHISISSKNAPLDSPVDEVVSDFNWPPQE